MYRYAVAMTEQVDVELAGDLLRADGQEDVCLATYATSTGAERTTCILREVCLPRQLDRQVHGNATIMGAYVLRVASAAATQGLGIAILHSHPRGSGFQSLSMMDADAERSYSNLVEQITGLPLLGLTLAGDRTWSARVWVAGVPEGVGSVRRVGLNLKVWWDDDLVSSAAPGRAQLRTAAVWGDTAHRDITRLRVLVVGAGSVGLDVVQRLAATGFLEIGVMDFDRIGEVNRDRMIGATRRDASLRRLKVDIAARLARRASTAASVRVNRHRMSITSPEGLAVALDYDVIFSCVDKPWPRAILNTSAYADLVPVIDGGIAIDTFASGKLRGVTRRSQVAVPGRACLACSRQINMSEVALDMSGALDDAAYIRAAGREPVSGRPNVAVLCAGVSAAQLELLVSLVANPGGQGVPLPLRFSLAPHLLEHLPETTQAYCETERNVGVGDARAVLTRLEPQGDTGHGPSRMRRWIDGHFHATTGLLVNARSDDR